MPLFSPCIPTDPICNFDNCAEFGNIQTRPNNSSTPQVVTNTITGNFIQLALHGGFGIPLTNGNIRLPHSSVSEFPPNATFLFLNATNFTITISSQSGVVVNGVLGGSVTVLRGVIVRVRHLEVTNTWSIIPAFLQEFPT